MLTRRRKEELWRLYSTGVLSVGTYNTVARLMRLLEARLIPVDLSPYQNGDDPQIVSLVIVPRRLFCIVCAPCLVVAEYHRQNLGPVVLHRFDITTSTEAMRLIHALYPACVC